MVVQRVNCICDVGIPSCVKPTLGMYGFATGGKRFKTAAVASGACCTICIICIVASKWYSYPRVEYVLTMHHNIYYA